MSDYYNSDDKTALEARSDAQRIAFAPFIFQATIAARNLGLLDALYRVGKSGLTPEQLAEQTQVSLYGVKVLMDMGLSSGIAYKQGDRYLLSKTGYFILNDSMTQVNLDFTQDVCYQGLAALESSIREGKPEGLKVFGEWTTIYPALSSLPEPAKSSWFEFDHYYSDQSFPEALPKVLAREPKTLMDIGANTGQWCRYCLENSKLEVTVVDLPEQLTLLEAAMEQHPHRHRVKSSAANMLDANSQLPGPMDAIWMSQFLDCFSEQEIVQILTKCRASLSESGYLYIMETFWDQQPFEIGALAVNCTSLYFTAMANGNSRMYHLDDMKKILQQAGFTIVQKFNELGVGHTLLECRVSQ